jgi:hypothetical protein
LKRISRMQIVKGLLWALLSHGVAWSQEKPADVIAKYSADISIPDSPAAAALGVKASSIVMPTDPREFAASLLSVSGGQSGNGAAVDISPMLLFAGRSYTITDYETSRGLRAAIRTTLGFAGAKKTIAGSDYSGYGVSVSTLLLNAGDAVLDKELRGCVNDAQQKSAAISGTPEFQKPDESSDSESSVVTIPIREEDALSDPGFAAAVKKCFTQSKARNWNRSRIAAGLWTTKFEPPTTGLPDANGGTTAWITVQYGFDNFQPVESKKVDAARRSRNVLGGLQANGSLTLHYRYTRDASDVGKPAVSSFPEIDTQLLAMRFTYGSEARAAFIEYNRTRMDSEGETSGKNGGAVGGSFRLSKDLWFSVALGRRQEFSEKTGTLVSASFKYGTSSEPVVPSR